jgi:hypothetical protein
MEKNKFNGKKKLFYKKDPPLGHKEIEYYSEKELFDGIQEYTWEELSKSEIKFYKNYGKKKRKQRSRNDCGLE